jgi:hypothetical protein
MIPLLLNLGLLFLLSTAAGTLVLRRWGKHLPYASRLALIPVLGAAVVALLLFAVFLVVPLGPAASTVAFLPALVWLATWRHRRKRRRRRLPLLVVAGLMSTAALLILVPFYRVGGAESFGIFNNDN